MNTFQYEGKTYTCNTYGAPDAYIGTDLDIPNNFYWQNGSKKEGHHWILRKAAIELGLINN